MLFFKNKTTLFQTFTNFLGQSIFHKQISPLGFSELYENKYQLSFSFICAQKSAAIWQQQVKIFPFLVPWQVLMRVLFIPWRQWAGNSVRKSGCCCDNSFPHEAAPLSCFGTEMLTSRPVGISCLWCTNSLMCKKLYICKSGGDKQPASPALIPWHFGSFPLPPALPVPLFWNPLDRSILQSLKWEIGAFLISFSSISAVP